MIRSIHAGSRQSGGFSLNVFTDDELEDIHLATLEVLQKTGVFVGDDEAMDVYEGAGAVVDRNNRVVKIPPLVVEDAIQSVPSKFIACGRTPKNDVVLERNRVTFTNFGEGIKIIDPYTGEQKNIAVEAIVTVTMRSPHDSLFHELQQSLDDTGAYRPDSVTRIGDCLAPSIIAGAVFSGHRYARELDTEVDPDNRMKYDRVFFDDD